MTAYAVGDSVRDNKWGGTYTGTVVRTEGRSVYVQWHNTFVEDQLTTEDIVPAPEIPRPEANGLRLMVFGKIPEN